MNQMRRVIFPFYLHSECWNERRANWFTLECKKKPVKAYSMYLKMLYRLISVRFTQEFKILTLFYFRSRVSLPVFFFGHSFGKNRWRFFCQLLIILSQFELKLNFFFVAARSQTTNWSTCRRKFSAEILIW